jgi:hypothetical protein
MSIHALLLALPSAPVMPQILPADRLDRYARALPQIAHAKLIDVFGSPSTLWYDKTSMIPSYQDSVGDGSFTPIGARANSQGLEIIVPEGRRLFDEDGVHWSFPFGHTAGLDQSHNKVVINFLSLPIENDAFLPIVYDVTDDDSARGGLGLHQWRWMFPKGTIIGEVVFIENPAGKLLPTEVRVRRRWIDGWSINAYRPFPTARSLADAIERLRPAWESQANLRAFVEHLEDPTTLEPRTVSSPGFNGIVTLEGSLDVLPSLGDPALVEELLTTTTFVSSYGLSWKSNGGSTTFAPSTLEDVAVVPIASEAGLLEVRESSCTRCHQNAGKAIEDFEPAAVLYGDIWGSDQIFSFHPWDQDRYVTFNTENREVRPELTAIVHPYDTSRHPSSIYRRLPDP